MKIIKTKTDLDKIKKGCVLTIGNFDGIHLGHQKILSAAKKIARQRKTRLIVMTFEPHPAAVLFPEKKPEIMTPLVQKQFLLAELGVDYFCVLKTTRRLLNLSPADFVDQYLVKHIRPHVVVEGESFNFGSHRAGNIKTLKQLGTKKGFEVVIVKTAKTKLSHGRSAKISSTMVRNLLHSGRVADAALTLNRYYRLIGQIVPGQGKGKLLGFPTANMQPGEQLVPAEGVYAGFVEIAGSDRHLCSKNEKIPAVFSIGRAETFGRNNPLAIEAHILTPVAANLTGKWLAMDFVKYLRPQRKFDTPDELARRIAKDCEKAKKILAKVKFKVTCNVHL
jgi:riboflavin kinase/FMN adenylyltransferase